jgi:hypothetical protein
VILDLSLYWYIAVDTLSTLGSLFLGSSQVTSPFYAFCVLGVGSDPRAASLWLGGRVPVIPNNQRGGGGHHAVRPLEKAIRNIPLARLMVSAYYFFFYDRNSTKMRHFNNLPRDDGSRRSTQCPPSHPSMALPSHPAQASAWMARPSGPLTHAASMGRVSPLLHQPESTTYSPPTFATMGGGILSNGSSSDAVGTSDIVVSLDGSIF